MSNSLRKANPIDSHIAAVVQSAEKAAALDSAKADVIKQLLPLVDNFELAKGQVVPSTDGEQKIADSYQVRLYMFYLRFDLRHRSLAPVCKQTD